MDKDCPTLFISKPPENGRKMRKINRFDDPFAILSLLQAPFKSPGKEAEFPFIDSQSVKSENRPVHRIARGWFGGFLSADWGVRSSEWGTWSGNRRLSWRGMAVKED